MFVSGCVLCALVDDSEIRTAVQRFPAAGLSGAAGLPAGRAA